MMIWTLVAVSLVGAPAAWAERSDPILELYQRSGMQHQLREFPRHMEMLSTEAHGTIPPHMVEAIHKGARVASDSIDLDSTFLAGLRRQLSPTTTRYALKFFDSRVGKAVAEAEHPAQLPEGITLIEEFLKQSRPQDKPDRARLFRILDAALGNSDMLCQSALTANHALAVALDATRSPEQREGSDALWERVRQNEAQLRYVIQKQVAQSYFYIYRTFTEDDLREYIRFATSDEGLVYHRILRMVMLESLSEFEAVMSRAIVREMKME